MLYAQKKRKWMVHSFLFFVFTKKGMGSTASTFGNDVMKLGDSGAYGDVGNGASAGGLWLPSTKMTTKYASILFSLSSLLCSFFSLLWVWVMEAKGWMLGKSKLDSTSYKAETGLCLA